jgi:hypothetical protein
MYSIFPFDDSMEIENHSHPDLADYSAAYLCERLAAASHHSQPKKEQNISKMKIDQTLRRTEKLEEKPFQAVKFKLIFFHKQPPNSMGERETAKPSAGKFPK